MSQIFTETFRYKLTLPTAKAGGFLLQPLLHWMIPCGISTSYTVSTSWIILFPYALRCSLIFIYADRICSPFFKMFLLALISMSCTVWQSGHSHIRTARFFTSFHRLAYFDQSKFWEFDISSHDTDMCAARFWKKFTKPRSKSRRDCCNAIESTILRNVNSSHFMRSATGGGKILRFPFDILKSTHSMRSATYI